MNTQSFLFFLTMTLLSPLSLTYLVLKRTHLTDRHIDTHGGTYKHKYPCRDVAITHTQTQTHTHTNTHTHTHTHTHTNAHTSESADANESLYILIFS